MKKTLFIIVALILVSLSLLAAYIYLYQLLWKQAIYIAVAAPLSGPNSIYGQEMLQGIRLYLEKIRREGRFQDKRIELLTFDDYGEPKGAREVAQQIVSDNKAILVLGHYSNSTALAAAKLYKKHRVPAITASASAEEITLANEWYFRIFPGMRFQEKFIANYLKYVLQKDSASIIFDAATYNFFPHKTEYMRKSGVDIPLNEAFDTQQGNLEEQLTNITRKLSLLDDPGGIFLATHQTAALKIITLLQEMGTNTDNIYGIFPFMVDTADHQAQVFKQEFAGTSPEKPMTWVAACYYDATAVALKAIEHVQLEGEGHIRGDRQKIQSALINFYDAKNNVHGITGDIYFDANRDVQRPLVIGIYRQQHLLPAVIQYQPNLFSHDIPFEHVLSGKLLLIDQYPMAQTQVVYTGIHINDINNFNLNSSRSTIDFYLWFRFQQDFDVAAIEFINTVAPIDLKKQDPLVIRTPQGIKTQVYHLTAEFIHDFDFRDYPFDSHEIAITFRHSTLTREELIYVPDPFVPQVIQDETEDTDAITMINEWKIMDISPELDVLSTISTLGNPEFFDKEHRINYSQFGTNVLIEREDTGFAVGKFALMIVMMIILSVTHLFPSSRLGLRVITFMGALIVTTLYHIWLLADLPVEYLTPLEYVYFIMYVFLAISMFISVSTYSLYRKRLAILQHIELFQPFSDEMKAALSQKMTRHRFKQAGQTIIRAGERNDSLFVVLEGELEVWIPLGNGEFKEVNHLKPGDFFGEIAMLTGEKRTASVISKTPVFLGEISKTDIALYLKHHQEVVNSMIEEFAQRKLPDMQKRDLYEIQQKDKETLLAEFLENLEIFFGAGS